MEINFTKNQASPLPPSLKSPRDALIEIVLLSIVCALFGYFIIMPKAAVKNQKLEEQAAVTKKEQVISEQLATLQTLVDDLQKHKTEISKLDQALPLEGSSIDLNLLIESLARSSGVTIGDINISSKDGLTAGDKDLLKNFYKTGRSLQKLSGSIHVEGSYDQLKLFLNNLETSARLIDVLSLGMDSSASGSLNMQLTINAYYLAP